MRTLTVVDALLVEELELVLSFLRRPLELGLLERNISRIVLRLLDAEAGARVGLLVLEAHAQLERDVEGLGMGGTDLVQQYELVLDLKTQQRRLELSLAPVERKLVPYLVIFRELVDGHEDRLVGLVERLVDGRYLLVAGASRALAGLLELVIC